MVNKKLHWVAVIFLVLSVFSLVYGVSGYLNFRDPNKLPEANEQTVSQNNHFKVEIKEFSRGIEVWQNSKTNAKIDALIVTTKDDFEFISVAQTDSTIAIGGKYIFSKEKSYPGLTEADIKSEAENYTNTKLDLPILYFEGQRNIPADSALNGTILSTALFGTIALFSYIYSRESKKIIIKNSGSVVQIGS